MYIFRTLPLELSDSNSKLVQTIFLAFNGVTFAPPCMYVYAVLVYYDKALTVSRCINGGIPSLLCWTDGGGSLSQIHVL